MKKIPRKKKKTGTLHSIDSGRFRKKFRNGTTLAQRHLTRVFQWLSGTCLKTKGPKMETAKMENR